MFSVSQVNRDASKRRESSLRPHPRLFRVAGCVKQTWKWMHNKSFWVCAVSAVIFSAVF